MQLGVIEGVRDGWAAVLARVVHPLQPVVREVLTRGVAVHDEAQDGLEVVAVEGHLRLLCHVYVPGVPGALAVAQALQPLAPVGRMEHVHPARETEEGGRGEGVQYIIFWPKTMDYSNIFLHS